MKKKKKKKKRGRKRKRRVDRAMGVAKNCLRSTVDHLMLNLGPKMKRFGKMKKMMKKKEGEGKEKGLDSNIQRDGGTKWRGLLRRRRACSRRALTSACPR